MTAILAEREISYASSAVLSIEDIFELNSPAVEKGNDIAWSGDVYVADYTLMFEAYDRFSPQAQDAFTTMALCVCLPGMSSSSTSFESSVSITLKDGGHASAQEDHGGHDHCEKCGADIEKGGSCSKCAKH